MLMLKRVLFSRMPIARMLLPSCSQQTSRTGEGMVTKHSNSRLTALMTQKSLLPFEPMRISFRLGDSLMTLMGPEQYLSIFRSFGRQRLETSYILTTPLSDPMNILDPSDEASKEVSGSPRFSLDKY